MSSHPAVRHSVVHHPDLEDLDVLVLVARTGSIGQAARQLGLSQPSVSRRVARLERSLRVPVLQRGPRGSLLTPTGKVVVEWAATLLEASHHFLESVQSVREHRVVSVRVAASMTIAEHLAPTWITRLRARSPDVVVSLAVNNSSEVSSLVESGGADIGFVESPSVRSSLRRRRLRWDRLVVAVHPDHRWARRRSPITPAMLAEEPLLVREEGSGTRETLDDALARHHLRVTAALTLASNAALTSSAVAGIGPAVLSALALAGQLSSGQLVEVPVEDLELRRPLSAVWRRDERPAPAAADFLRVAETTT
jgi:molybdate transport repressor ModE-like protein